MQLQADVAETVLDQAIVHDRERRHLLGHEQDLLPVMHGGRHDVGDGLRLPGARRPLNHEIVSASNFLDCLGLRRIRIDDLDDLRRGQNPVELVVRTEQAVARIEALGEQAADQLTPGERDVRPVARVEVAHHQKLGERKESELHRIRLHAPAGPSSDHVGDLREIFRGQPVVGFFDLRQYHAEVLLQSFLQRQVGGHFVVSAKDVVGRSACVPDQLRRQQNQRRLTRDG